ncbi:OmpA family protein [Pseudohalocynthiibacter aestuariivivens]|uniref:OmpA family protein n=1 Tax=Roseovarius pelagicus TaxID=2980108 RepID=A0ABY6DDI2_9RHOB|nr:MULTISPECIES: OmpA family protein [Rhodobacterales]QIE44840.1 OmpA family protein [Pseudohalocynthiibacter aestuariivivens]UXX83253.1 OmpA family protein [Roseovarius pelagicus]
MTRLSKSCRNALGGIAAAALGAVVAFSGGAALAQQKTVIGENYTPTIWVDPDGCEHWVMDDGWEGYMSPHTNRQGIPVCRRGNVCGVMNSDQLFATDSARISSSGQQYLANFFRQTGAVSYIITGHTDSRASDQYNMNLSLRRANSVARVAASTGARIADVRGYGERMPKASNNTAAGMQQNRRVEIICIR